MNKFLTLFALLSGTAMMADAQSLAFCYQNGTEIPSGTSFTVSGLDPEMYEEMETAQINSGIYIKNLEDVPTSASLTVNITEMSGGELSCCLGTQCRMYSAVGSYSINNVSLLSGVINDAQLHASSFLGEFFTISATLTLSDGFEDCSTIDIKFVYNEQSPIASLNSSKTDAKAVKYYDLLGRETSVRKGVLIEKLSDGRCRKVRFN